MRYGPASRISAIRRRNSERPEREGAAAAKHAAAAFLSEPRTWGGSRTPLRLTRPGPPLPHIFPMIDAARFGHIVGQRLAASRGPTHDIILDQAIGIDVVAPHFGCIEQTQLDEFGHVAIRDRMPTILAHNCSRLR